MFQTGQLHSRISYMPFHTLTSDEDNNMYIRFNIRSPSSFRAHTRMKKVLMNGLRITKNPKLLKNICVLNNALYNNDIMTFARTSGISL